MNRIRLQASIKACLVVLATLLLSSTIWAEELASSLITYIDENGIEQSKLSEDVTEISSLDNFSNLSSGWYLVSSDLQVSSAIQSKGDINLIIANGATLTVKGSFTANNIAIYGQKNQAGNISVSDLISGIQSKNNIVIAGVNVVASAQLLAGMEATKDIFIAGGEILVSGDYGLMSDKGNIYLGSIGGTAKIKASDYRPLKGSLIVADGFAFQDEDGNFYTGDITDKINVLKNITLSSVECGKLIFETLLDGTSIPVQAVVQGATPSKPEDPKHDGFVFAGWFADKDYKTPFDWTATITEDVSAYAKWNVTYIDQNGKLQIKDGSEYTMLTNGAAASDLSGGWYVVAENMEFDGFSSTSDVNIIVADGASLKSTNSLIAQNIAIYGQKNQNGSIMVSGDNGIVANGNIVIVGGNVTATANDNGIYAQNNVTIVNGKIDASGTTSGIKAEQGDISLGWIAVDDQIRASKFSVANGKIVIAEGLKFKDESGDIYEGDVTDKLNNSGKTLLPYCASLAFITHDKNVVVPIQIIEPNSIPVMPDEPVRPGFEFLGWFADKDFQEAYDWSAPINGHDTAYAKWAISYIDENGELQKKFEGEYVVLTNESDMNNLADGWFVFAGEVSTSAIKFTKKANLILADNANVTVKNRVENAGIDAKTLSIYGQANQSGKISVQSKMFGIDASKIIVNGGNITVNAESQGIYGVITLNNGNVSVNGLNGIYISDNSSTSIITINGGTLTAHGTNLGINVYRDVVVNAGSVQANGITARNITINGGNVSSSADIVATDKELIINGGSVDVDGTVKASSGKIVLGWTNNTDFIKAGYYSAKTKVIKDGQKMVNDNGFVIDNSIFVNEGIDYINTYARNMTLRGCYALEFVSGNDWVSVRRQGVIVGAIPYEPYVNLQGYVFDGWYADDAKTIKFDFTKPLVQDTVVYAKWLVPYKDKYGELNMISDDLVTEIHSSNEISNVGAGCYLLTGSQINLVGIHSQSNLCLIVADGAKVNINSGNETALSANEIAIYGQEKQTGKITINSTAATKVHSSLYFVNASSNIEIVDNGSDGNGILSDKYIELHAGSTIVHGSQYGLNAQLIQINGGVVEVNSTIAAENGILVNMTKATDRLYAKNYSSNSDGNGVRFSNPLVSEDGKVYRDKLNDDQIAKISEKKLYSTNYLPTIYTRYYDEDGEKELLSIDGEYQVHMQITYDLEGSVDSVVFNRKWTPNAFSTLTLPFNVDVRKFGGLKMLLKFNGVKVVEDPETQKKYWSVRMKKVWEKGVNERDMILHAFEPSMVLMESETLEIKGPVTMVAVEDAEAAATRDVDGWQFKGTLTYKKWKQGFKDYSELGNVYGFAASDDDNIEIGQFVKAGEGAWIPPFRAYLYKKPAVSAARANYAGNSVNSPISTMSLPEVINVEMEEDDENGGESKTTVIGRFNTRTGEFTNMYAPSKTYDIKGRNVGNKANKARGAYYAKKNVREAR